MGKPFAKSTSSVPVLHNGAGNSTQQKNRTRVTARSAYKTVAHLHHKHFCHGRNRRRSYGLIRLVLCTVPAILLLTSKQCAKAVGYIAVFSAFYAVQIYVLPHLTGILNFLVLFTTGFFCRIFPVLRLLPMQ